MANPVESLTDAIAQRLRNPIVSTYTLSWGAWNWEIWPYTFEATPAWKKVQLIGKEIYTWDGFTVPLVLTAFIVLGVPFLQAGAMWVVSQARLMQLDADARVRAASNLETEKSLDAKAARLDVRQERLHQESESLSTAQRAWDAKATERGNTEAQLENLRGALKALQQEHEALEPQVVLARRWKKALDKSRPHLSALASTDAISVRAAMKSVSGAFAGLELEPPPHE